MLYETQLESICRYLVMLIDAIYINCLIHAVIISVYIGFRVHFWCNMFDHISDKSKLTRCSMYTKSHKSDTLSNRNSHILKMCHSMSMVSNTCFPFE